jgi:hypothetical protein
MRWLAGRLVLSLGLTLSLATGVRAQAAAPADPWSLSLGLGEIYDSNLNFSPETGVVSSGEFGTQLSGGGGRRWVRPRGSVSVTGNVAESRYSHTASLNAFTYGLGADASYDVTRRLKWTGNDTLSSAYAQDTALLTRGGLILPKVIVRTNSATSAFSYAVSPKTQVHWGLSTQDIGFASPQFAGAYNIGTTLNVSRRLGTSQTVGVGYDYQITNSNGVRGSVQALQGTWQRPIGQSMTLAVSGGVRPYTLPGFPGYRISPAVTASLTAPLGSIQSFVVSYDEGVETAIGGIGTHETQGIFGTYTVRASGRLSVSVGGNYVRGIYPQIPGRRLNGRLATTDVACRLMNNLGVVFGGGYYHRHDTPGTPVSAYRASLSMAYRTSWR